MRRWVVVALVAATVPFIDVPGPPVRAARATPHDAVATRHHDRDQQASGHEDAEGLKLVPATDESVGAGPGGCRRGGPIRRYDVSAVAVDITVNRYLDHDPKGRMFVLDDELARVRREEAANAAARSAGSEPAVSAGLQGDAIQPLVLRVRPGECLRVRLRNALEDEPASFHVHGSSLRIAGTNVAATAAEPRAVAAPGREVTYEWAVPTAEPEATHAVHSHGDGSGTSDREQTNHGLFGAVVVEPKGSTWSDPLTGRGPSGWLADVVEPGRPAFREFVLIYHEIGNENYQLRDHAGDAVPLVDPFSSAYRPASRAVNYRSEPFMNRIALDRQRGLPADSSLDYSSYSFGDPATPIGRSYVGDPVRQRVVHGGSETFHVHHVHGGAIRWPRQPGAEPPSRAGRDKHPALLPQSSERTDSQTIGPSETFDVADECGSGGCQQSVGDFLYHCHVAHHYFAGMWGLWRVYNTLQDGAASTDSLPPLRPLPRGGARPRAGVTSSRLSPEARAGVAAQLPPPGVPRGYDASVWDWRTENGDVVGEPETAERWPGYQARAPGTRPAVLFDPATGRVAYPFMRPHLGKRPPFAPGHGPAPFLGDDVCPPGTKRKQFAVNAVSAPVTYNQAAHTTDANGQLFVLRSERDAVLADNARRVPLAIRANAGEDCVDVLFRNELDDPGNSSFAKASVHVHFMQFDVQASDGVTTGFNYEQTIRPYRLEGVPLSSATEAGAGELVVADGSRLQPGVVIGVGLDRDETFETATVAAVSGRRVRLTEPLRFLHGAGEFVGTEFLKHRWYPDAQFGTAYFHDHVDALRSWSHGLYGAIVGEPPGSTYHDPRTGAPLASGPLADIHTEARVSADVEGSFRELLLFVQDDVGINHVGRSSGSAYNLRAEPLDRRVGDPSARFSSRAHGDPATPIIEADIGDPVVVRSLVGATNDVHTVHLDGHWFRAEPHSTTSPPVSTIRVGISERFDLVVPAAGGAQRRGGDYLYYSGRSFKLREGSWGLVRVRPGRGPGLQPLPGRAPVAPATGSVCPIDAPRKRFAIDAVDVALPMLSGRKGKAYVVAADREAVLAGTKPPEPLVLRVNQGDCVEVHLTNRTTSGPVTFGCDLLSYDPAVSAPVQAGRNGLNPAVAPAASRTFTYYADPELGRPATLVRDWGDVLVNPGLGLYGAVVVGAPGTTYRDPVTGAPLDGRSSWRADARPARGRAYRDFALFLQDDDAGLGTHRMPYTTKVGGTVGLNYGRAPATPVLDTYAGDPVRLEVLAPWSEQAQVFSVEGHTWPQEPGLAGTNRLSSVTIGGLESPSLWLDGGAGGAEALPGAYRYGDHRDPYREAGMSGTFRVRAPGDVGPGPLRALPGPRSRDGGRGQRPWGTTALAVLTGLLAVGAFVVARRRRPPSPRP
ncbi:MAG TPA: multicopper oxidase domain-containing protein [Acidimicrobiales bacterium]|nr:multicopper oxidase domain-containing protein [Acidimicrobiales bacterium]